VTKHLRWYPVLLVILMLSLASIVTAQEATAEPEAENLPVVPYFQSYRFNVPVLVGWDNQSAGEVAFFVNDDLQASIRIESARTPQTEVGIETVLRERFGDALPDEPAFINSINLADGAWVQEIYTLDDGVTVSAFGNSRNDNTYVITFVEENPDADTYMLIVARDDASSGLDVSALDDTPSPEQGVLEAIETLITDDFETQPDDIASVGLPSGEWTRYRFESDEAGTIRALGLVFGRATYATITTKAETDGAELANAFNTIHLGFFTTPDNSNYLWLGVIATFAILGFLVISLYWRWRSIRQDMALLEQLRDN
jgi:hypothetical protein